MPRIAACALALLFAAACGTEADPDPLDAVEREHAGDSTQATALVQPPRQPVAAQTVRYGPATGYYALPQDSADVRAGLLVIHEWWGLNDNVRAMAERFAGEGYRVLAVDLYDGRVAATPDSASALMRQATADLGRATDNLRHAYDFLRTHGAENVGVVGWCMGGFFSLQAALALPSDLDAAVIYYGNVGDVTAEQLRTLQMPVRAFFGGADSSIPAAAVERFDARLSEANIEHEVTTYEGAGHAFANPTGANYQPGPAQDSWQKTLAFLDAHLR